MSGRIYLLNEDSKLIAMEEAGYDSDDGGGPDGPSLDDAGVVEPTDPPAALGRPQAARTTTEANSSPSASCGMTTVQWGASR